MLEMINLQSCCKMSVDWTHIKPLHCTHFLSVHRIYINYINICLRHAVLQSVTQGIGSKPNTDHIHSFKQSGCNILDCLENA